MTEFRKSPLNKDGLKQSPVTLRERDIVDINILTQEVLDHRKEPFLLDFKSLFNEKRSETGKTAIYNLAIATQNQIKDGGSHASIITNYRHFRAYVRFCDTRGQGVDPFSKAGFLAYCGRTGELVRRVALNNKPLDYVYHYDDHKKATTK